MSKKEKRLESKSGKMISLIVVETSKNPIFTIIESHGGFTGNANDVIEANKKLVKFCENQNINYVAINFSNNSILDQNFGDIKFSDRIKDLETAIDFIDEKYRSNIILLGSSLGGFINLNAANYSTKIKGIILNCAAVRAHECIENTSDRNEFQSWKTKGIAIIWDVTLPFSFYEDLIEHDATKTIPKINIPILWFHGTADQVVPIDQARDAKQLNSNIELVEVKDGGHRFGDKIRPGEWEEKVENFITKL